METYVSVENELYQKDLETVINYSYVKAELYLEKIVLKSKLKELKGNLKPFDKIKYHQEVRLAKENSKLALVKVRLYGRVAKDVLRKKSILITNDGTWFESKKNVSQQEKHDFIKNYKKLKLETRLQYKKNSSNIRIHLERLIVKCQTKIKLTDYGKDLTYQQEYLNKLYRFKLAYYQQKSTQKKFWKDKITETKSLFLSEKTHQKELKAEYFDLKNKLKEKLVFKIEAENLAKQEIIFLKNKLKLELQELKYKNKYFIAKTNYYHTKQLYFKARKDNYTNYLSEISTLKNGIPFECNHWRKWWVTCSGIIPGVGQILNGQLIKGLILMFVSIPIISVFLMYAFGIGNVGGNGLFGLKDFGTSELEVWPDSNFYLIEGVISLVLFAVVLIVILLIIRDTFYGAIKLEKGSRLHNWSETRRYLQNEGFPYLLSIPALFLILFIVIVPIISTIFISFTNYGQGHIPPGNTYDWVGLENYKKIFSGPWGLSFRNVLSWTVIWTIFATMGGLIAGMGAAFLLANKRIKGRLFFRIVLILPWAIPAFITIMLFSVLFGDDNIVDSITRHIGLQYWKRDELLTKIALIFIQSWLGQSYIFLLTTGVMQGISKDLYDAAKIDGAGTYRRIFKITLPIILIQIAPLLLGSFTFNFNNFSIIWLFNGGGPAPIHQTIGQPGATDILLSFIFKLSTGTNNNAAMGAAFALLTSVIVIAASSVSFKNMKAFKT